MSATPRDESRATERPWSLRHEPVLRDFIEGPSVTAEFAGYVTADRRRAMADVLNQHAALLACREALSFMTGVVEGMGNDGRCPPAILEPLHRARAALAASQPGGVA